MIIATPELPLPSEWGWSKKAEWAGMYVGQPYLKPHKPAGNSYVVAAKRTTEDAASASRLPCSALLFVCAVDFVLTDPLTPTTNSFWHDY